VEALRAKGLALDPAHTHYLRLERLSLGEESALADLILPGVVESREYYGLYIKYSIRLDSQLIRAIEKNDGVHIHEPGEQINVGIMARDLMRYDAQGKAVSA